MDYQAREAPNWTDRKVTEKCDRQAGGGYADRQTEIDNMTERYVVFQ